VNCSPQTAVSDLTGNHSNDQLHKVLVFKSWIGFQENILWFKSSGDLIFKAFGLQEIWVNVWTADMFPLARCIKWSIEGLSWWYWYFSSAGPMLSRQCLLSPVFLHSCPKRVRTTPIQKSAGYILFFGTTESSRFCPGSAEWWTEGAKPPTCAPVRGAGAPPPEKLIDFFWTHFKNIIMDCCRVPSQGNRRVSIIYSQRSEWRHLIAAICRITEWCANQTCVCIHSTWKWLIRVRFWRLWQQETLVSYLLFCK
jgi:hypothetical protein